MGDVARGLILPDIEDPNPAVLRNLSVYWDELLCPLYEGKSILDPDDSLVAEGVIRELERDIRLDQVFPVRDGFDQDKSWSYRTSEEKDGDVRVELVPNEDSTPSPGIELEALSDKEVNALAAIGLGRHLGFVDDALSIAATNNLGPISHSLAGHLGAVVGSSQQDDSAVPAREAALLSVVVKAFAIDPSATSSQVVAFREKSPQARARLRGALVDLAAKLQGDAPPAALLEEARDTYINRVEPALGLLEETLKENGVTFFLKSLVGATAIAIAPIEPISTATGTARVIGQTIDYSYSKSRLVREHPYGYLHEVREAFDSVSAQEPAVSRVESQLMAPRDSLRELWREYWINARERERKLQNSQASSSSAATPSIR